MKYLSSKPFSNPPPTDDFRRGYDAIDWGNGKKPKRRVRKKKVASERRKATYPPVSGRREQQDAEYREHLAREKQAAERAGLA